jgi:hypothetical protein
MIIVGAVIPDMPPGNGSAPTDIISGDVPEDIIWGPGEPFIVLAESPVALAQAEEWINGVG